MKVCKECGYSCEDDAKFCSKCGEYFPGPEAPAVQHETRHAPQQGSGSQAGKGPATTALSETVSRWTAELRDGAPVDDELYRRILDDCVDGVFKSIGQPAQHPRASVSSLAMVLDDYDLSTDVLKGIADRASRIGYQKELMNAANQYLFLSIDAFSVYTDLGDLKTVCDDAVSVFESMKGRVGDLEPVQSKNDPVAFLENYASFFSILGGRIADIQASSTPERLEFLSDYWADRSGKGFSDILMGAANMNVQLVGTGKIGSMIATKGRDMQLDAFVKMYTSPKE